MIKHIKRRGFYYLLTVASLFFACQVQSQKLEHKYIREGNEYYAAKEYGNAEVAYNNALDENEKSYAASFNLGDAYYRQLKTDKAIELFSSLITVTANKENLADLYYNLGTIKLSNAIQNVAIKDYDLALKDLDAAIEYYKNSLKNNPKDRHTKYNLSLAQQLKKDLEKIQQDNPNEGNGDNNNDNNDNDDKNNDKNDNKDNKNDKNKDKNNEADTDQDGIPDKKEKGDNPNNPTDTDNDGTPDYQDLDSDNDGKPDEQEAGSKPTEPKDTDKDGTPDYQDLDSDNDGIPDSEEKDGTPKNQQISMEDALRWLENIENEEKRVQEKVKKAKASKTKASKIKNW